MKAEMLDGIKVLLIGGTSHVGKSTFARRFADQLGWSYMSTDQLARHPGRPWRDDGGALPDDVIDYFLTHSIDELVTSVMQHYSQNVWPIVDAVIRSRLNNPYEPCLVLEGSSILPDRVLAAAYDHVHAIWLTASEKLIASRIAAGNRFESSTAFER